MIKRIVKWIVMPLVVVGAWQSGSIGVALIVTGAVVLWWVGKKALKLVLWGGGAVLILYFLIHMARP